MAEKMSQAEYNERKRMFDIGLHWCTKCCQYLILERFSRNKSTDFGYFWWCKDCHSKSRKGNKQVQKKAKRYNRELKSHYKRLMGGECAKCGYAKTQAALEFHHVEPENKEAVVTALINSGKHIEITHEINKCILLCRNCHQELESNCWDAKFIKSNELGYEIQPDSIIECEEEYWTDPSNKVLYSQQTFLNGKVI